MDLLLQKFQAPLFVNKRYFSLLPPIAIVRYLQNEVMVVLIISSVTAANVTFFLLHNKHGMDARAITSQIKPDLLKGKSEIRLLSISLIDHYRGVIVGCTAYCQNHLQC